MYRKKKSTSVIDTDLFIFYPLSVTKKKVKEIFFREKWKIVRTCECRSKS